MAISQPSISTITAFDATKDYTIKFSVSGDSEQVVQNRIVITTNTSDNNSVTVYDNTVRSFQLEQTIPGGTLTNSMKYFIVVYAIGTQVSSSPSASVGFSCYTTPTITWDNIENNNVVNESSHAFSFTYNQAEGRALESYNVVLYNASYVSVEESGNQYTNSSVVPYTKSQTITGMTSGNAYSIQVTGYTEDGMEVASPYVTFVVSYGQSNVHTQLFLTNNCQEGYVVIQSGVMSIEGITDWEPKYIDDEAISLIDGNRVTWGNGFSVNGDFTMKAWGRNFVEGDIIMLYDEYGQEIRIEYCGTCVALHVTPGYVIFSNELDSTPSSTDQIFIWLRRSGSMYDIRIENKGAVS